MEMCRSECGIEEGWLLECLVGGWGLTGAGHLIGPGRSYAEVRSTDYPTAVGTR